MNKTNSILPFLLILAGFFEMLFPAFMLFVSIPQIVNVYQQQAVSFNPLITYGPTLLTLAIVISQIVFGIRLFLQHKQAAEFPSSAKRNAAILLICGVLVSIIGLGLSIASIITPLYSALAK